MSLISLRLPDELDELLNREARTSKRAKSEIARTAIADYLQRQERERFMADYVRTAMREGREDLVALAEEALPLDNEALALTESGGKSRVLAARESRAGYGKPTRARRPR